MEKRVHQTMAAADINKQNGMVTLQGTDKQVAWAEDIRNRHYSEIMITRGMDKAIEAYGNLPLQAVNEHPEASWWIENKIESYKMIIKRIKELAASIKK